ncbi:MAG: tRNA (adenosine(37)-N6)-threonylcarbamoyltransferase complex ATPase subunit type 1 TsaE [Gammaproteobacteria bacterium]|nr:tRNA (adenosine(37)-N6)-threonylcarbamoyltransferase complex ATPase subunit type 1 TsaE [Gammaproteobacteria bacterium]
MPTVERMVNSVAEMEALGARLAARAGKWRLLHLRGPLGAGKTTLVRGILRGLGHAGAVKSPTFTLVEPYTFGQLRFFHFDLYRLSEPGELEFLGVRDYLDGKGVCVVEWAERGKGVLPSPDMDIMIEPTETGRMVRITTLTPDGDVMLEALK